MSKSIAQPRHRHLRACVQRRVIHEIQWQIGGMPRGSNSIAPCNYCGIPELTNWGKTKTDNKRKDSKDELQPIKNLLVCCL